MNKTELVNTVAERADITKKAAEQVVDATFDAITEGLASGDKVQLVGFGVFEVKDRAAREGRNPHTGDTIKIPASKAPVFKPGKTLKDKING